MIQNFKDGSEWPESLLQYSSRPLIFGDHDSGFWAHSEVTLSNGYKKEFAIPRVWTQGVGVDQELLELVIAENLIQTAAVWVERIVRMNTPAVRD